MALKLNEIRDNKSASKNRKRIGRGMGSGKGKTSGMGHKGQKARTGVALNGFEGGQNPLYRRLPKRGFNNIHAKTYYELTFKKLNALVESKKIDTKNVITETILRDAGVVRRKFDGVSLIATGSLEKAVKLEVTRASAKAIELVKKAGGEVTVTKVAANDTPAAKTGDAKTKAEAKKAEKSPADETKK